MKITDLSPKMSVKPAFEELVTEYIAGELSLGENVGGLQMFSNAMKRGYGANTFGVSEEGMWLGAADYADAPFKISMDGTVTITNDVGSITINASRILAHDADTDKDVAVFGNIDFS